MAAPSPFQRSSASMLDPPPAAHRWPLRLALCSILPTQRPRYRSRWRSFRLRSSALNFPLVRIRPSRLCSISTPAFGPSSFPKFDLASLSRASPISSHCPTAAAWNHCCRRSAARSETPARGRRTNAHLLPSRFARFPECTPRAKTKSFNYRHVQGNCGTEFCFRANSCVRFPSPNHASRSRSSRRHWNFPAIGNWHTACFCLHFKDGFTICHCRKRIASSHGRARHSC